MSLRPTPRPQHPNHPNPWGFYTHMFVAFALVAITILAVAMHRILTRRVPDTVWYQMRPAGAAPELDHVVQHAVSAAGQLGGNVTAVVTRRPEGVVSMLGIPQGTSRAGVNAIARAVNAVVEETEPPPLSGGVAVTGRVPSKYQWSGATSNKGDTAHAARSIGDGLAGLGDWVAVVARPQTSRESNAIRSWYSHIEGGPTVQHHPGCSKGAMVASTWAGGANHDVAASHLSTMLQSLAGFDVTVNAVPVRVRHERMLAALVMVLPAMFAAWFGFFTVPVIVLSTAAFLVPQAAMSMRPGWYGAARRLAALRAGSPRRIGRLRPFHPGYKKEARNEDGSIRRYETNDYPFRDDRVPIGAQHVAFVAAPHTGAASGSVTVRQQEPPAEMTRTPGVLIGTVDTARGETDVLLADQAPRTLAAIGIPGSGKSELLRSVFASDCVHRVAGDRRSMIVLESQGGRQVDKWVQIARNTGVPADDIVVIDINDPSTPAIDMFAGEGTPHMRAGKFLDLFFESDESGSDGGVALTPSLQALLAVGLEIRSVVAERAGVHPGSPIWYASVLAGNQAGGDGTAQVLWAEFLNDARAQEVASGVAEEQALTARSLQRTGAGDAAVRLASYMSMKEQERRREFQPAGRRLAALLSIDSWFDIGRERFQWATLIDAGKVVVLNHGDPASPDAPSLEPQWADRLARMLLSGIRTGIRAACQGWDDEGRRLVITADELSIVAGADPETPEWLRQQARKYGVDLAFATQAAHQLDERLLKTVLGFGTMMWLPLGNEPSLLDLARNYLSVEPGVWDTVVDSIPQYHAIALTSIDGARLPGALVSVVQASELPAGELRRRTLGR